MFKARQGAITNMSSVVFMGNIGQANYAASQKLVWLEPTKSVAREVAVRGASHVIAPGFIESDMTDAIPTKMKDAMIAQVPRNVLVKQKKWLKLQHSWLVKNISQVKTIAIDGGKWPCTIGISISKIIY